MTIRWILGDTETTGPKTTDKVCELAWAELFADLTVVSVERSLIDPEQPICPSASGIHHIVDSDVADSPTIEEFFSIVKPNAFGDDPVVFIAHNVDFDLKFFKAFIPNLAGKLCTLRLARRHFPDAPNHKLDTLRYYLNIHSDGQNHRADKDVLDTVELLRVIVERSGKSLQQLYEEASQPILVRVMPFGKHKDTPIPEMVAKDRRYAQWLLGTEIDSDLRFSIQKAMGA